MNKTTDTGSRDADEARTMTADAADQASAEWDADMAAEADLADEGYVNAGLAPRRTRDADAAPSDLDAGPLWGLAVQS